MVKSNVRLGLFLSLLALVLLIQNCKKDDDGSPGPVANPPVSLAKITDLAVMDIGEAGNGSDLQVSFAKVADETNVSEYRIFVVNSAESADFDLERAEEVPQDNFQAVAKTGNNIFVTLTENLKTTSGVFIGNDIPYKIFVLTASEDTTRFLNVLSAASDEITLTTVSVEDKVKVTYIANDGVMIEFEDKKVVIDAINRASNLGGWVSPSNAALMAVENGDPPYDDIDIIMITHNHGDHYSTTAVQNYLSDHPNTKLIIPSVMEPSFSSFQSQIADFSVNKFERINIVENDISIDVLHVEHFDQFGNDFSGVESFAYIVNLDGKKFLHAGDIDYLDSQLDSFNLLQDSVTVAFIPTFGDLVSLPNRNALINNVNPENIVCLHFLTSTLSTTLNQVNFVYPNADVFTTPFQTREY